MNEKTLCEKCGRKMMSADEKLPIGKTCPNCGWGWVTSYITPIYNDTQIYTVTLSGVTAVTKEDIQTIAEIMGQNYLQTKKVMESLPQIVFSGKAPEVVKICGILKSKQNFEFEIHPQFPYDIVAPKYINTTAVLTIPANFILNIII